MTSTVARVVCNIKRPFRSRLNTTCDNQGDCTLRRLYHKERVFVMIDLMLLGTGAMVPLPGRYLSATMFRIGSHLHLIDCGEGTQVAMREFGWGFKRLDTILISHFHADHIAGLPGLMHTLAHSGKTDPLHIYGPEGLYQVVSGLFVIVGGLPFEVFIHEVSQDDTGELPGGAMLTVAEGKHRGRVLTYRVDVARSPAFLPEKAEKLGVPRKLWSALQRGESVEHNGVMVVPQQVLSEPRPGVSFGFATDTRPTESIVQLMQGVDLLIAEGTYGDDADVAKAEERGHMTFRESATLAKDCGAGALWITHFGAGMTEPSEFSHNATEVFPNTTLGRSGLTGTVSFDTGYSPS